MAQAALQTRVLARTAYDVSKRRATTRGAVGNVNLRLFETAVITAGKDFDTLEKSHILYLSKAVLDEGGLAEEMETWEVFEEEHAVWFQALEDQLHTLKIAEAPPVQNGITDAMRTERDKASIVNKKEELTNRVVTVENSVTAVADQFSMIQIDTFNDTMNNITASIDAELPPLYAKIAEADPDWVQIDNERRTFIVDMGRRMDTVRFTLANNARVGTTPVAAADTGGGGSGHASSYANYRKEDNSTFDGKIRSYPPWSREWKNLVARI